MRHDICAVGIIYFWTHETSRRLCGRILKAGGVDYVDYVDRIREQINNSAIAPVPRPSRPSSAKMSTSGFTQHEFEMVKHLRAEGRDMATAILCTKAITALPGTMADVKEVASLVLKGVSFEAAIMQIRQRMPDGAPQGHELEVEDDSENEDEDEEDSDDEEDKDEDDEEEVEDDDDEEEEEEEEEAESDHESPIGCERALDHLQSHKDKDTPIKPLVRQSPPPKNQGRPKDAASSSVLRGPASMVVHTPHTAKWTIQPRQAAGPPGFYVPARTAPRSLPPSVYSTIRLKAAVGPPGWYNPVRIAPFSSPPGAD